MRAILFALCIVLQIQVFAEGCNGEAVGIGKYFGRMPLAPPIGTVYFAKYSTYTLSVYGNFPCGDPLCLVKIYFGNTLLAKNDTSLNYKLDFVFGALPGNYRIETMTERRHELNTWKFEIADNPLGLVELGNNYAISVFPNPATAFINVSSEKEITTVSIYSVSGAMLAHFKPSSMSIQIPIEQYPPGIYFLNVAILGEQTVIKKIVIQ